jgi:DMSO/TMAO reductase YedYZ molybdopterin-dependent catalytic subunit
MGRLQPGPRSVPLGRAAFLATVAGGVASIPVLSRFGSVVSRAIQDVTQAIPIVNQVAPSNGWRIYSIADSMPVFDPATWRLKVTGLVRQPRAFTYADVLAQPRVAQVTDFHCVTGWSVDRVHWQGVRPSTLIDLVQPLPSARYVTFVSMEQPYVDQLSMTEFRLADVLVASHLDGQPLTREHGAPLRLVIPQMYGYKNVKWLSEIRFDATPSAGYWEQNGYDVDAWVGKSNGYG